MLKWHGNSVLKYNMTMMKNVYPLPVRCRKQCIHQWNVSTQNNVSHWTGIQITYKRIVLRIGRWYHQPDQNLRAVVVSELNWNSVFTSAIYSHSIYNCLCATLTILKVVLVTKGFSWGQRKKKLSTIQIFKVCLWCSAKRLTQFSCTCLYGFCSYLLTICFLTEGSSFSQS